MEKSHDLSVLIPARNEEFLGLTVKNILKNRRADTEVIVVLDGEWADPPIEDHPDVRVVYHSESIGQRAATNEACKLSKSKYVMKCDAHCAFDEGFDVKMIEEMHDDWTMVPLMKNLHAFDWVCTKCGEKRYQGPSGVCTKCGGETEKDVMWEAKKSPNSVSYCFDSEPHFQYFGDFAKRPEGKGDISPTMSLQGSCFMMTRDKYWELNICDEEFGSWGSQGIEVAVKTWLSGGQVMCNRKTWYAHMFRTQGGDFGFPYKLSGNQVSFAKKRAKELFFNNKWDKQIHPLSWLVEKFWPVKGWSDEDLRKLKGEPGRGIIYYTDNQLMMKIAHACRKTIQKSGLPIVSASLKPMDFGKNVCFKLPRGYLTMFKQILGALELSEADVVFFTEHDVLYHPSHFDFVPPTKDKFYYNQNVWRVRYDDGFAVHYDCNQLSGMCCYRELAIKHYKELIAKIEKDGWDRKLGFEPGTHNNRWEAWKSKYPNVDIRHGANLTKSKWSPADFRNAKYCVDWKTSYEIPGWGKTKDILP